MIKRITLVWKKPELSNAEFRKLWLGEHVEAVKRLPGLREYVICFVTEGPSDSPAGIATVLFDSREALDTAFGDPKISGDLLRTREQFASRVQPIFVEEDIVVPRTKIDPR